MHSRFIIPERIKLQDRNDQNNYNLVTRINARLTPLDVGLKLMPPQGKKKSYWCPRVQSPGPTLHKSNSVQNSLNYTSGGVGAGWTLCLVALWIPCLGFIYGVFRTSPLIYTAAKIKTELIDFNKLLKNFLSQVLISSRPFLWRLKCGFNTSLGHLTAATILATSTV